MKTRLLTQYASHIQPGPLNGLIVVGFCYYLAGPAALQRLVEQGALVIKIERFPEGDPARKAYSSSIFNTWSHGQLSIAIDNKSELDRHLLSELFDIADVFLDNRSVEAQERDELLQSYLKKSDKSSPKIYCTINGFPSESEEKKMPGLDASVQAITGFAYTNASSVSGPLKVGTPIIDIVTGLLATQYIASNLYYLNKNKLPSDMLNIVRIDVPMAGTSMWLQSLAVVEALYGIENIRDGNKDRYAVPFSYYTTKDGNISIAIVNEKQFKDFCFHVLENASFHAKYDSINKRRENQDDFENELNELLKAKSNEYWMIKCKKMGIPVSPLLTLTEAIGKSFAKTLLKYSTDGRPVVTDGVSSFFTKNKTCYVSAPAFNQHGESLRLILDSDSTDDISSEKTEKKSTPIRSKL